ncbi:MAG: flagellar basal body-associated FliL family protein [Bdellovibrionota bacterium]
MADPKEAAVSAPSHDGGGADKSSKMMMGMLAFNMVVVLIVAIVLFLGQKKQAQQQTISQVEDGAKTEEHAAGGGEHGGGEGEHGGGEHGGGEHGAAKGEAAPAGDAHFFSVGDFTANLSGPASTHFAKIAVNFEVSKDSDEEEMKQRRPQFRDKIISLLNSKKPADLQSAEGRAFLKEEIKSTVNQYVKKGKVEGVYFSAFVIN